MSERPGGSPVSRRMFIKAAGGAGAGFVLFATLPGGATRAVAAVPGGTLDPANVPKFQTPLLIPPVMPRAEVIRSGRGPDIDYYEISVRQFAQQILPAGLPATTVWGYGAVRAQGNQKTVLHHAPSLTIEAVRDRPVRVKWINELVDADGRFLPHLLPVDPTLHWANPPGGRGGRDSRPTFHRTPGPYKGPVPLVTHVHGAVGVGDESDGYAEAWFLPAACDIPSGFGRVGTWYEFFARKAAARFGVTWGPGFAVFQYPNTDRAATKWYHDHTLGMTRLNVYAGPAGFYLIRGGPAGDEAVRDSRTGKVAVLPGPAPQENDPFPSHKRYYEIALAIQDRSFNRDGSLFYPDTRAFFPGGPDGPYIPATDVPPIWNPEFFGNTIIVNGNTWPFQTVEQRRYRLRFLNGCQSRFLILDFNKIPGVRVWAIGNEGGFLAAPVNLTATNGNRLLMGPAERADLIVDFTDVALGNYVLANVGPDEPFGGGVPGVDFTPADPATTGQVMQFRVVPPRTPDRTTPPQFLHLPALPALPPATRTRPLALLEKMSAFFPGAPVELQLGTVAGNPNTAPGTWKALGWEADVTENPAVGDTEVWEFFNATVDAHPIHIHEVDFQVVNRQAITVDTQNRTVHSVPGTVTGPEPWETGFKDTVVAPPGHVTRVRAQFTHPGQFVWHCHIVEHEDNEMMRPYRVGPEQPGQPAG
jgi:spore coat protein A, manganese oxidase